MTAISSSRPVVRDGQPVQCREAIERRDRLIEHLAALPPVQGALDQIVQRFGTDLVAEVTGRSRRIVRKGERLVVENRAGAANLAEAQAFMDDAKRILVFSDAGGTGRSYHADLGAQEPAAAGALSAGGRLEGRHRDPGAWPLEPHQPGAAAAVPADRDRRQGGEALPLDHRAAPRHARRHHQGPAPDRRPGAVPPRGQSRIHLWPRGAAPALRAALCRQDRRLFARGIRGRDRSSSDRCRRHAARGAAADHDLPQPAARAHHRSAERAVRRVRGFAARQDRGRRRVRHLRSRGRDRHGGIAAHRRAPHALHPSRDRRRDADLHHPAARPQPAAHARRGARPRRPRSAAGCSSMPSPAAPPCRCRRRA